LSGVDLYSAAILCKKHGVRQRRVDKHCVDPGVEPPHRGEHGARPHHDARPQHGVVASASTWFATAILATTLLGCTPSRDDTVSPDLMGTPCRLGLTGLRAQCHSIEVPENTETGSGRRIEVHFAVVSSPNPRAVNPPLVILVGGPGQAAMTSGVPIAELLREVRHGQDLVLVDQRGTGKSNPLRCPDETLPFAARYSHVPDAKQIRTCAESLDADTTQYTTASAAADLERVRSALGYPQWSLWGASYGTRVALEYAHRYPQHVARLVLDGAAPLELELPLHFARDAQASLEALQHACERSEACRAAFPSLLAQVERLTTSLDAAGQSIDVTHPSRGTRETVHLTRDGFLGGLRGILYSPELSALLPYALNQAEKHRDWGPFIAATHVIMESVSEAAVHQGMYLSVVCAEDVSRISDAAAEASTRNTLFGTSLVEQARTLCQHWVSKRLPESFFEPRHVSSPTLVLSGGRDPATPPRWGELVARRAPQSIHVTVNEASHGVTALGCAPRLIADFLTASEPLTVDTTCLTAWSAPAFFTRVTGP
jgi:pimeloyl-ACP methyl ester carboxylesterase